MFLPQYFRKPALLLKFFKKTKQNKKNNRFISGNILSYKFFIKKALKMPLPQTQITLNVEIYLGC